MNHDSPQFVPKVHPATRGVEPEDPLELFATPVFGDPEVMLQCLIQEYAGMGWDAGQIFSLFRDPSYPALNSLLRAFGEPFIREQIAAQLAQSGVFCCQGTVADEPEPGDELEMVELRIRAHRKRNDHAESL